MELQKEPSLGFSLIELIVMMGISAVLLLVFSQILFKMQDDSNRLITKAELHDVRTDVIRALASGATCLGNLMENAVRVIPSQVATPEFTVPIIVIRDGVGAAAPEIVRRGEPIDGLTSRTLVEKIEFGNWKTVGTNRYKFDISIFVTPSRGVALKPIKILRVGLLTDGSGTPLSCASASQNQDCRLVERVSDNIAGAVALCADDETLISGGGRCRLGGGAVPPLRIPLNQFGYLHESRPVQVGTRMGWKTDCFLSELHDNSYSEATAYCCRPME